MKIAVTAAAALCAVILFARAPGFAQAAHPRGRIVIVMVWDGLRPDSVTTADTPNLFAMSHEGTRFDRHHASYPTLTLVNAAVLATGAAPGATGILANQMYLEPALVKKGVHDEAVRQKFSKPVVLEKTPLLAELNGANAFAGRLLGLDTVAQELEREGGYLAVIGKQGPTFLWDNRVETLKDGRDSMLEPHQDYLFVTDDFAAPAEISEDLQIPPASRKGVADSARDEFFTRIVTDRAIGAARLASEAGRRSLILLWQHSPDLTQHYDGLGTLPALEALATADLNLAKVRAAIVAAQVADRTDLIVLSDHGFATIRLTVDVNALLAGAGLKKSTASNDVVVASGGGTDLIYLSQSAFPTESARRDELQKIVNFAEAQEWCGPIFSRKPAGGIAVGRHAKPYLGWIDGTFSQESVGIFNAVRSPDLVLSFGEIPDLSNEGVTGGARAFALAAKGQTAVTNRSHPLVHPVKGLLYADVTQAFTAGMGHHGSAGEREIHNFCAAFGPDFRHAYVDRNPTANADIAPTIAELLGLLPNIGPGGVRPSGRVLTEALNGHSSWPGAPHASTMTTKLTLQGVAVTTTLKITRLGDHMYLDGSREERTPLGSSP